jgi:hypothetical protein
LVRPAVDLAGVERARAVSLRRLEDNVAAAVSVSTNTHSAVAFRAPPGRAPDELTFELGGERWKSGDVRLGSATASC